MTYYKLVDILTNVQYRRGHRGWTCQGHGYRIDGITWPVEARRGGLILRPGFIVIRHDLGFDMRCYPSVIRAEFRRY